MADLRRFADFSSSSLKVWILLPLVGVTFWLTTGWISQQVLSQPSLAKQTLEAGGNQQVQLSFSLTVLSIDAQINQGTQITEVEVRTAGSALEELEFKFPVTELADVERAIARELHLPPAEIRKLIRYRIDE